jgi:hypothetical protein
MDHVAGPLHTLLAEKEGRFDLVKYVLKFTNLRELFGGVCQSWSLSWNLSWNMFWNMLCNLS